MGNAVQIRCFSRESRSQEQRLAMGLLVPMRKAYLPTLTLLPKYTQPALGCMPGGCRGTWHSKKSRIPFASVPTGTAPSRPSWLSIQGPRDRPSEPHAARGGHSIPSWARHQGNSTPTTQRPGQGGRNVASWRER